MKPSFIHGNWEAKVIDGRWCVGKAGAMEKIEDAAMVINQTPERFGDGVLAIATAKALSETGLLPPPYDLD